jgi:hypothetical protein
LVPIHPCQDPPTRHYGLRMDKNQRLNHISEIEMLTLS